MLVYLRLTDTESEWYCICTICVAIYRTEVFKHSFLTETVYCYYNVLIYEMAIICVHLNGYNLALIGNKMM